MDRSNTSFSPAHGAVSTTRRHMSSLALVVLLSACGGGNPAAPQPSIVQVAGQWRIAVRINSVTGGDCASSIFQPEVGRTIAQTLTLQQDGTTLSGTAPLTVYGVDCDFTGTAGPNNIALKTSRCSPLLTPTAGIPVTCPSGVVRHLLSVSASTDVIMTNNNAGSGAYTETFVVTNPAGQPVEPMVLSGAVTLTRQ